MVSTATRDGEIRSICAAEAIALLCCTAPPLLSSTSLQPCFHRFPPRPSQSPVYRMGQLFAATNPKKRSFDEMEGEDAVGRAKRAQSDWYMNKALKFKSAKVLNSTSGCASRTRSMKDLVMTSEEQFFHENRLSSRQHLNETSLDDIPKTDMKTGNPMLSNIQASDDDEEFESLTLNDMKKRLRKSLATSLKTKQGTTAVSDAAAPRRSDSRLSPPEDVKSPDNTRAVHHKSRCDEEETGAQVSITSIDNGIPLQKKEIADPNLYMDNQVNQDDSDAWTLEMWRIHKKGKGLSSRRKMKRQCGSHAIDRLLSPGISDVDRLPAAGSSKHAIDTVQCVDDCISADLTISCSRTLSPTISVGCIDLSSQSVSMQTKLEYECMMEDTSKPTSGMTMIEVTHRMTAASADVKYVVKDSPGNEGTTRDDFISVSLSNDAQLSNDLTLEQIQQVNPENGRMKTVEAAASDDAQLQNEFLILEEIKENTMLQGEANPIPMIENSNMHDTIPDEGMLDVNNSNGSTVEPIDGTKIDPCCSSNGSFSHHFSGMAKQVEDTEKTSDCTVFPDTDHSFGEMIEQNKKNVAINICNDVISKVDLYSTEIRCNEDSAPVDLYTTEKLDVEEEQAPDHTNIKPSKIPCKRKAISPLSQEKLIKASKMVDSDDNHRGLRKLPRAIKCYIGRDNFNRELCDVNAWTKEMSMTEVSPPRKFIHKEETMPGSPCHNRKKSLFSKSLSSKVPSLILPNDSPQMPVKNMSIVLNNTPPHEESESTKSKQPLKLSPQAPAKGILRLGSPACKTACKCEECMSMRFRAERAAEFSQQQMHDIEGLTVKLLKELNTMRGVLEETLVQNMSRTQSPRDIRSLDKVKIAASNAVDVEKMARSWLVRMARDCNRYCKIMRMQERKLTFADESGGQLCQVKLFHTQEPQPADNVNLSKSATDDCSNGIVAASIVEGAI